MPYSAEYGRAGGGVINVVTRSGTNRIRGSLFEFYRDKALNATSAINELNGQPKSPYHYHQFGGTLGGPIRKNRDFFFLNYDGQRNRQSNLVFLNLPPNTPDDPDTQAGIARLQPLAYSWDRGLNQDVYLIKTDHQLSASQRLTFRYNHQDFTGEGYENGGAQNSFEHTGASLVNTRTASASWTSVIGSRAVQRTETPVRARPRARGGQQRQPRRRRPAERRPRAAHRPQQLQPAVQHDRSRAGGRRADPQRPLTS